jgi:hypothetical protein
MRKVKQEEGDVRIETQGYTGAALQVFEDWLKNFRSKISSLKNNSD